MQRYLRRWNAAPTGSVMAGGRGSEGYFDGESSALPRPGADGRAVRFGDGGDDRQAETGSAVLASPVRAEPLEGLEQPLDLAGGHRGPGVGHPQDGVPVPDSGRDLDPAARNVVAQGVVGEVGHQ